MLSPLDLKNKMMEPKKRKYYDKDETDDYLELVMEQYKQLYDENLELQKNVKSLNDGVQYYRSIENTMQKALVLAEKTAKETKDAAQLKAEAGEQADAMRSHAEAEGQKEGYEQGLQEAAARQRELESRMQAEKEQLQADYDQKQKNMEHELVDVVCDVVEKVFLVQFGDKKEIIWHAVDQALANIEGSKEFMIRVGEANLEFLRAHKEELQAKVGQDMTLDIVLDPLLDETQCMIETDGGLFDCGMDTQMRNLIKDIKSLS